MAEKNTDTITVTVPSVTATTTDEKGNTKVVEGDAARKNIDAALNAPTHPATMREQATDLPEKDAVQKAYKDQILADNPSEEMAAKATIIEESPDASETPSGAALLRVKGEKSPSAAGERYARLKSMFRWGTVRVDEIND